MFARLAHWHSTRRRRALAAALLSALIALPGPLRAGAAAGVVGPRTFYLALGDSLAYGYQPNLDVFHGYSHYLDADFETRGTRLTVNMACPGESTGTFIGGGCPYALLHKYPYLGSQLQAALSFIGQHPGSVSPVTIDVGANDLPLPHAAVALSTAAPTAAMLQGAANDVFPLADALACALPPSSTTAQVLATFDANYTLILSRLRTALHGTGDILTMNYYYPYQNQCPAFLPLVQLFNSHILADAARFGVPVADVFSAFGGASTPNQNLCRLTWLCGFFLKDIHPNDTGYTVIAHAFESAAGY